MNRKVGQASRLPVKAASSREFSAALFKGELVLSSPSIPVTPSRMLGSPAGRMPALRWSRHRFMVPMHAQKRKEALHEP